MKHAPAHTKSLPAVLSVAVLLWLCVGHEALAELKISGTANVKRDRIQRLTASGYDAKAALLWRWDRKKLDGERVGAGKLLLTGPPGDYSVELTSIQLVGEETKVEEATFEFRIEATEPDPKPPEPPGPGPGPQPPGPTPNPLIGGEGFRVLMVYDEATKAKLPREQLLVLQSKTVRDYLRQKCSKDQDNPDGAFRIWNTEVDTTVVSKSWQDAMKRERKSLPWIVVSNGKTGYEGPLPKNVDDALSLLKKYAEGTGRSVPEKKRGGKQSIAPLPNRNH